ncbi:MAG: hypothetical protein JRC87_02735 [Deltaproteobacteria bacterium]|nr:hypothetical protein [Deltaproteobacteria bacterium]
MGLEYSFTLTVPLADLDKAMEILARAKQKNPAMRQSRKTDRHDCARIYLSFPFSPSRPDLAFQQWFLQQQGKDWDLFGPDHGLWGLS